MTSTPFKLDPTQELAIEEICKWYSTMPKKYFVLAGRAGTGKSSIVKMAVDNLAIENGNIAFIAPTGKASMVMRKKGITNAITMHKLIYIPVEKELSDDKKRQLSMLIKESTNKPSVEEIERRLDNGEDAEKIFSEYKTNKNISLINEAKEDVYFVKVEKESLEHLKLIVCDEASLLNDEQIEDLESFGVPVLYIGDHHQLPPVKGFNSRISNADVKLETIHRQGGESGIIKLASSILDNPRVKNLDRISNRFSNLEDVSFIQEEDLIENFPYFAMDFADQILCSTNRLRSILNNCSRIIRGFRGRMPVVGDRLMCTRNNYEHSLVNGLQCEITKIHYVDMLKGVFIIDIKTEANYSLTNIMASLMPFFPTGSFSSSVERYHMKSKATIDYFDFGYACTVHKSQGSEWNNVLYVQSYSHQNEANQLHYTAVTRAAKNIVVTNMLSNNAIDELDRRSMTIYK